MIQEKIAALAEISPQTVSSNFTYAEFEFEILEKMNAQEPNYAELEGLFQEVTRFMEETPFNLINEKIAFKTLFLHLGYGFDIDFVNALICVDPILKIEFKLSKLLADNEFFVYYEAMFKEFKGLMEINLKDMIKSLEDLDLGSYVKELEGAVSNLNDIANSKN